MRIHTKFLIGLICLGVLSTATLAAPDDVLVATSAYLYQRNSETLGHVNYKDGVANHKVAMLSNGQILTVAEGWLTIRNPEDLEIDRYTSTWTGITAIATRADHFNGRIAFGFANGDVMLLDNNLVAIAQLTGVDAFANPIDVLAFQHDGDLLVAEGTTLNLRSGVDLAYINRSTGFADGFTDIAIQSDDDVLIATTTGAYLRDSEDLSAIAQRIGFTSIGAVAVESDDKIVMADGGSIYLYYSDFAYAHYYDTGYENVVDIAVQSDDDVVIAGTALGGAFWIRTPTLGGKNPPVYDIGYGTINNICLMTDPVLPPSSCAEVYQWGLGLEYDINSDCYIDLRDFALIAANWMNCNRPDDPACTPNWQ